MTFQKRHVVSEETRHKMSEAHKGANNVSKRLDVRKKISNALKGHLVSENARKKISNAHKGMKHSSETRIRMSKSHTGTSSGMKGKKHTAETLSKISSRLKGRVSPMKGRTVVYSEETRKRLSEARHNHIVTEDTRKKLSEARRGYKCSEQTKRKISEALRGQELSEQTRRKLSETHKSRKVNCGENNPMYGKSGVESPTWNGGRKASVARRKSLGFIPLNDCDDDSWVGHHLDKEYVLYIPKELHTSIGHKQSNQGSMDVINDAVFDWYVKYNGLI